MPKLYKNFLNHLGWTSSISYTLREAGLECSARSFIQSYHTHLLLENNLSHASFMIIITDKTLVKVNHFSYPQLSVLYYFHSWFSGVIPIPCLSWIGLIFFLKILLNLVLFSQNFIFFVNYEWTLHPSFATKSVM